MLQHKTRHNWEDWKKDIPNPTDYGKSETIPHQALSMEDIIKRHANGLEVPVDHKQKWLESDELVPRLNDLTDIDAAKSYLSSVQAKIDEEKARVLEKETELSKEPEQPPTTE